MRRPKTAASEVGRIENVQVQLPDLICFSHLRWNFVYQRPQHLMSRFAQERRVFYVEEPEIDQGPARLVTRQDESGVTVVVPYIPKSMSPEEGRAAHIALMSQLLTDHQITQFFTWYYTPMALPYTRHLKPCLVVYDCMDELSAFNGAPKKLTDYEKELLATADLVFTGGQSLYEAKRDQHPNVYAFPSSIDYEHFHQARYLTDDPKDQSSIPHPRLGFYGVIDERMDIGLLGALADSRPDWHLVIIGPVAKVDPDALPRQSNIHYLGMKSYAELPAYLAGWDAALLPFAQNRSTRFISPTKTPEYLAGGKPVISTPIRDVVRPYGDQGLVWIADTVSQFVTSIEKALGLNGDKQQWLSRVDKFLSQSSWDHTWMQMKKLIDSSLYKNYETGDVDISMMGTGLTSESISAPPMDVNQPRGRSRKRGQVIFDYLIVGAGFAGSVLAERLACGSGKKVLLIDKRNHIGGNAYDHFDDTGLLVHKYGPHIFHTNSREVFAYLSRFTKWRQYEHRVRASVDGQLLPMPINLDTINRLYGLSLTSFELESFFEKVAEPKDDIRTSEDVVVSKIGRELYEKFFRNYTRKQWDLDPSELDASVTSRVPIRLNRDDRYFSDTFQSMPLFGYTRMFENMLDHPNIKVMLNTDYHDIIDIIPYREMIYTGPVDEYFDFCFGKLPYRSLQFKFETLEERQHQEVAVINYPNEHLYTRVTEFKHLTGQDHPKTSLVYEYPCSEGDPYYPIPRPENADLYKKYKALAESVPGVFFAGRLATYKYYNMDQVTAQALTLYARITGRKRGESLDTFTPNRFQIEMPCSLLIMQEAD